MQAVVLVGGEGTRLRPLTLTQPKPALALVDRPFIRYMVDWLGHHGVDEVVMACGFRPADLRAALGDGVPGGVSIRYLEEDEPLGTAGPVRLAADRGLLGEQFMVLNGDVLTDLDLTALQRQHSETDAVITLALYPVEDPSSYGLVRTARGWRGARLPREARPGADRHRPDQRRRLRGRELGARADPAGARGLDRARGLPAPRRAGPVRAPARGLLDGHRHAAALPAGQLGHPRGRGADRPARDRRAVHRRERPGGARGDDRAAGRGSRRVRWSSRVRWSPSRCCSTAAGSAPKP